MIEDAISDARIRHYGFLLVPGFAMMSYASALEPLRAANTLAGRELYRWRHCSSDGNPVQASSAVTIAVDGDLDAMHCLDTVVVCAGGNPATFSDAATLRWLRTAARHGLTIGGVSAGPYILAKAGLLDGHRATVHWEHGPAFAEAFPRVSLMRSLFEIDRGRLTCAGGVAALDMMHEVIGADHGYELARAVGDWFLQAHVRPGTGSQRLGVRERFGVRSAKLEKIIAFMETRIEEPAGRAELAAAAGVSLRQLNRLFAGQLGLAPERFYLQLRVTRARELLRQTNLPITEVAIATGFASASHFSRSFKAHFGRSPRNERGAIRIEA